MPSPELATRCGNRTEHTKGHRKPAPASALSGIFRYPRPPPFNLHEPRMKHCLMTSSAASSYGAAIGSGELSCLFWFAASSSSPSSAPTSRSCSLRWSRSRAPGPPGRGTAFRRSARRQTPAAGWCYDRPACIQAEKAPSRDRYASAPHPCDACACRPPCGRDHPSVRGGTSAEARRRTGAFRQPAAAFHDLNWRSDCRLLVSLIIL